MSLEIHGRPDLSLGHLRTPLYARTELGVGLGACRKTQLRNRRVPRESVVDGTQAFPKIFEAIDNAKDSVHVSFFIFHDDKLGGQFIEFNKESNTVIANGRWMIEAVAQTNGMPK